MKFIFFKLDTGKNFFLLQNFKEIPLEGASAMNSNMENNSEPTLKRLRLRGDWSDTGPQAVPQGERTNQAEGECKI